MVGHVKQFVTMHYVQQVLPSRHIRGYTKFSLASHKNLQDFCRINKPFLLVLYDVINRDDGAKEAMWVCIIYKT